jgi:hypothetical protein
VYVVAATDLKVAFGLYRFELPSSPPTLFQTYRVPFGEAGDALCVLMEQSFEIASELR